MTNTDTIQNKISSLQKYISILLEIRENDVKSLKQDVIKKGAVERYLYLAIQSTIDLGEMIISLKNLRKASTYKEVFEILHEEKIIEFELLEKLQDMVGFRNIITHDYETLDYDIVTKVLNEGIDDIQSFIITVEKNVL